MSTPAKAAVVLVICLVSLAIISRHWGCEKHREPRPPRIHATVGTVRSVEAANHITIAVGRRQKAIQATADDVVVSLSDTAGMALTESLCPVGSSVTLLEERPRRILGDAANGEVEAAGPACGEIKCSTGADLALALIEAGLGRASADAPQSYRDAEKAAKKNHK
jgi:hypothetical protein